MNKKGIIFFYTTAFMGCLFGIAFVTGMLTRDDFRVKKANERCIAEGGTIKSCKAKVEGMSKEERLEYIRDTVEHPQPPNE